MSQAPARGLSLCGREPPPERLRLHVVGADALVVDLDHRDQLAVTRLQLWIAVDRDPLRLETELATQCLELSLGALAEMTPHRPVEHDPRPVGGLRAIHLVTDCHLDIETSNGFMTQRPLSFGPDQLRNSLFLGCRAPSG